MYTAHPSAALNLLFKQKPYQGANPREADFLFVGLAANYTEQVEHSAIFPRLCEYLEDGVGFWRRHKVHHPYLLPEYAGDEPLYHRSFARTGFKPEQAHRVSFVHLLHVPTVGKSKLVPKDLSHSHLSMLGDVLLNGAAKHIFIPSEVERLMHASKAFDWLASGPGEYLGPLGMLYRREDKAVYSHLHFSVFGKFDERKAKEAAAIHELAARYG